LILGASRSIAPFRPPDFMPHDAAPVAFKGAKPVDRECVPGRQSPNLSIPGYRQAADTREAAQSIRRKRSPTWPAHHQVRVASIPRSSSATSTCTTAEGSRGGAGGCGDAGTLSISKRYMPVVRSILSLGLVPSLGHARRRRCLPSVLAITSTVAQSPVAVVSRPSEMTEPAHSPPHG
jgi:hypothetical protein